MPGCVNTKGHEHMQDIAGEIGAIHSDAGSMSEKQDRLQAMVQQLGSMLQTAAGGMQGQGQIALQRVGEEMQNFGTMQAVRQGDHSDKMNANATALETGVEDAAGYIGSVAGMTV